MMWLLGILLTTIAVVGLVGWIWMVVIAFNNSDMLWAIGCFFIPPLAIVYGLMNYDEAQVPFWLVTIGFALRLLGGIGLMIAGGAS